MRSEVFFSCSDNNCAEYQKRVEITIPDFFLGRCQECYRDGVLEIKHGNRDFNSSGSLIEFLKGLMREQNLLNRLKVAGIASNEELVRTDEVEEILKDAVCPCCNQKPKLE